MQQLAWALIILPATCEQTLATLHAADNRLDVGLVEDLKRMVERTRAPDYPPV